MFGIIRGVIELLRVESFVIPLLEFDGVRTTPLGGVEQLFALLHRTLVVVPDFSDNVTIRPVVNHCVGND
jgi:hypothetical protein